MFASIQRSTLERTYSSHIYGGIKKEVEDSEDPSDIQLNLRSACDTLPPPEWLSQTNLKKQYHMCRLIYEVLTPGPERISIL